MQGKDTGTVEVVKGNSVAGTLTLAERDPASSLALTVLALARPWPELTTMPLCL